MSHLNRRYRAVQRRAHAQQPASEIPLLGASFRGESRPKLRHTPAGG